MDAFKALGLLAAVLWFASAVLWALGAMVEIRDNQDAFIGDLQRAGRWNSWAAATACAAAFVIVAICDVLPPTTHQRPADDLRTTCLRPSYG